MLTPDDGNLITRAIIRALSRWSLFCVLAGIVCWLIWVIISHSLPE